LARYQGRTLETDQADLRAFFQWAADVGLEVLAATRPHIELYVRACAERGWPPPPSTVACRRCAASTASPTSTGRIPSNPAQYVRRPKVHPSDARGLDHVHAALAVLLGLDGFG